MLSEEERIRKAAFEKAQRDYKAACTLNYQKRIAYSKIEGNEGVIMRALAKEEHSKACKAYWEARTEYEATQILKNGSAVNTPVLDEIVEKHKIKDPIENLPTEIKKVALELLRLEKERSNPSTPVEETDPFEGFDEIDRKEEGETTV